MLTYKNANLFAPALASFLTDMRAFNNYDWVPNRGACIDACVSGVVTRSFRLYDIKLLV